MNQGPLDLQSNALPLSYTPFLLHTYMHTLLKGIKSLRGGVFETPKVHQNVSQGVLHDPVQHGVLWQDADPGETTGDIPQG